MNEGSEAAQAATNAMSPFDPQYIEVFNNLQVGIVIHDADSRLILANRTAERLLGYSVAQMRGATNNSPIWSFYSEDDRIMPVSEYPVEQAIRTGKLVDNVLVGISQPRDEGIAWVLVNAHPITDADGAVLRVVTSFTAVTELRETRRRLSRALTASEAATKAKSAFLANMSHELRTPLTAVIGFGQALESVPDLPQNARAFSQQIVNGGTALLEIINSILEYSALEDGTVSLSFGPTRIRDSIAFVVSLLSQMAAQKGIDVRISNIDALPPIVSSDRIRVQQILLNLVGNAVKFTDKGEVEISCSLLNDEYYTISVRDTGPGIAPERLEHLFQRFSSFEDEEDRRPTGAGLGLAISQRLAGALGGRIDAASRLGHGSTFTLTLPQGAPGATELVKSTPSSAPQDQDGKFLSILVAEDNPANRTLLQAILEPLCDELKLVEDGLAAVHALSLRSYDVVLMDLRMPRMNGLEATRLIREKSGPNQTTPIIALSAEVALEEVERMKKVGFTDHVGKPFDFRHLWAVLMKWAGASASSTQESFS